MKREITIYIVIFLILALGMHHKEWLSHPVEHLMHLPSASAYGLGMEHPFVFALLVYLIVWLPRGIMRIFSKKRD
jgi:hypothetical protein